MIRLSPINFKKRMERALEYAPNSAILVMSMPEAIRNSDVDHPYRQDSALYYFLGFGEPESALLLVSLPSGEKKSVAFLRPRNPEAELWSGRRLGTATAPSALNVDEAYPFDDIWKELPRLIKGVDRIYFELGKHLEWDLGLLRARIEEKRLRGRQALASKIAVYDIDVISGALRLQKDPEEIERMREAARITQLGFDEVFKNLRPGFNERTVHATLIGEFMKNGAEMEAYPSIVAGGANACCLHYRENCANLSDNQLLLIDAGAQFQYYAADVTRTVPVGKKFTMEQKAVYQAVLEAQLHGISLATQGNNMVMIHDETCRKISESLVDLGFLEGSVDSIIESKSYRKYYPHGTGHWLGMDVHDSGDYAVNGNEAMKFKPGMCFTVEPGIYIDPDDTSVPKSFRGIGVRIEDDVLVTAKGPDVLTKDIPKQVSQLEDRY